VLVASPICLLAQSLARYPGDGAAAQKKIRLGDFSAAAAGGWELSSAEMASRGLLANGDCGFGIFFAISLFSYSSGLIPWSWC
jgi:hypothetical protein